MLLHMKEPGTLIGDEIRDEEGNVIALPINPEFIIVEVKQEHIDEARKENKHYCPIDVAMREMGYAKALMGSSVLMVWGCAPSGGRYDGGYEAFAFTNDFDSGRMVNPTTIMFHRRDD